jgi:hypothetical protein
MSKLNEAGYIPLDQCIKGMVYRVESRNLSMGVFDGGHAFIGVRNKFGTRYLFGEHHYDDGPPNGTVEPLEELGMVPEEVNIDERSDALLAYLEGLK